MTDTVQLKMDLAEATTDAGRSLERTRRKIEGVLEALSRLQQVDSSNTLLEANIQRCRLAISELTSIYNDVRKMNT